jgi:hypothetical protein
MSDLTRLTVWDDPAICGALSWYLAVAENRRPAKFALPRRSPRSSIRRPAARMRSGPNSTASRRYRQLMVTLAFMVAG